MKNEQIMKVNDNGVLGFWIDRIKKEFIELIDKNEDIQKWWQTPSSEKLEIRIKTVQMSAYILEQLLEMKRISKKSLKSKFFKFIDMETSSIFTLRTLYFVDNGKIYVKGCVLIIRTAPLLNDLSAYMRDLDYLWKLHCWLIRHELGHFIDHIVNDNGITIEEFDRRNDQIEQDYERHYEWLKGYEKEPGYSVDTVNRAYYNIPSEAKANECACIDIEEMIALTHEHDKKYLGKATTVKFDVIKNEDVKKE